MISSTQSAAARIPRCRFVSTMPAPFHELHSCGYSVIARCFGGIARARDRVSGETQTRPRRTRRSPHETLLWLQKRNLAQQHAEDAESESLPPTITVETGNPRAAIGRQRAAGLLQLRIGTS